MSITEKRSKDLNPDTTHAVCFDTTGSYCELEFTSFAAANDCYAALLKSQSASQVRVWSVRKGEFL